jgi:tripartite motif-containing protein 71
VKIIFYTLKGEILHRFGERGGKAGQYNFPLSLVQMENELFICDSWNNRIVKVDLHGNFLDIFSEADEKKLSYPSAIWRQGKRIYILDSGNKRILKLKSGKYLKKLFTFGDIIDSPVTFYKYNSEFYISDNGNHTIFVFNPMGKLQRKIGVYGANDGELDTPEGVFVYKGILLVCNSWNHRIELFTTEGEFLQNWGRYGIENGYLNTPTDILIEFEDEKDV